MKLILVRHGQSEHNVKGIMQGHISSKLTEQGKKQAQDAADILKNERIDEIYASDLGRVIETANIINTYHQNKIKFTPVLRERSMGKFEGQPAEILENAVKESGEAYHLFRPDGGESCLDTRNKMIIFLNEMIVKHAHQTILLVTSGGNILELLLYLLKAPREDYKKYNPPNCGVSIINCSKSNNCKLLMLNSKKIENE
ncbi:histidine phosphatase family protein [Candidatus Woesearchaeota archaeon]|nr:histidine phosphatase family protein [Candidatus Woesearchaeota archaeon]